VFNDLCLCSEVSSEIRAFAMANDGDREMADANAGDLAGAGATAPAAGSGGGTAPALVDISALIGAEGGLTREEATLVASVRALGDVKASSSALFWSEEAMDLARHVNKAALFVRAYVEKHPLEAGMLPDGAEDQPLLKHPGGLMALHLM